jgi:hypothetical protein
MKSRFKNKKLVVFSSVLLVIVAWVGSTLYDQAQKEKAKKEAIAAEQQYFAEAEEYIESFVQKVKNVSRPNKITNKSSCRYQSRKFEQGPLQCSAEKEIIFTDRNLNEANNIMLSISKLNPENRLKESLGRPKSKFEKDGTVAGHAATEFSQSIRPPGLKCVAGYDYPGFSKKSLILTIVISCYRGNVVEEHFPVE